MCHFPDKISLQNNVFYLRQYVVIPVNMPTDTTDNEINMYHYHVDMTAKVK